MSTKKEGKFTLNIPVAIVIAAIIIGGALLFGGSGGDNQPPEEIKGLGLPLYSKIAKDNKIKEKDFSKCIEDPAIEELAKKDFEEALAVGVGGTPTSFVVSPSGQVFVIGGAMQQAGVEALIEKARQDQPNDPDASVEVGEKLRLIDEGDYILGNPDAEISIIEYSDFQCPYCARFHLTMEQVVKDNSDVKWAYRHFPLGNHPEALPAAIATECGGKLGGNSAFWNFASEIFKNQ